MLRKKKTSHNRTTRKSKPKTKPTPKSKPIVLGVDGNYIDLELDYDVPEDQALGMIEQDPAVFSAAVACDDYETYGREMIPRSQWKDVAAKNEAKLRNLVQYVHNQGREGACVGNGCVGATESRSVFQFGKKFFRPLSPMSIYNRIGRSSSSGAYVPDGINELTDEGPLPLDTPGNKKLFDTTYRETGFVGERRMTKEVPEWKETAALFRVLKVLRINTIGGWFSALNNARPIVYGRNQHCIYSLFTKYHKNDLFFGYINSWSNRWGDTVNSKVGKGLGWDSERLIRRCQGYAIVEVTLRDEVLA